MRRVRRSPSPFYANGNAAKFSFINLPAEVVAALAAADGGKLRWLGMATVTKDYMHFDFRDAEIPKPYRICVCGCELAPLRKC